MIIPSDSVLSDAIGLDITDHVPVDENPAYTSVQRVAVYDNPSYDTTVHCVPVGDNPAYMTAQKIDLKKNNAYSETHIYSYIHSDDICTN